MRLTYCCIVLLIVLVTSPGWTATYWVDPSAGSDANACGSISGSSDPSTYKATIGSAAGCLASGDTLMLKPGTYTADSDICNGLPAGTDWALTTKVVAQAAGVILKPASGTRVIHCSSSRNNYVLFDGGANGHQWLTFDGDNVSSDCIKLEQGSDFVRFQGVNIRNCSNQGLLTGSSDWQLSNFTIDNIPNCTPDCHGIYVGTATSGIGDNILIEKGVITGIHDTNGYGIQFFGDQPDNGNAVVRYNLIQGSANACLFLGAPAKNAEVYGNICLDNVWGVRVTGQNVDFHDNSIIHTTEEAFLAQGNATTFKNNVIVGADIGLHIYTDNVGGQFLANRFYLSGTQDIDNDDGADPTVDGNLCTGVHDDCDNGAPEDEPPPADSSLLVHLKFDEGTGTTAADSATGDGAQHGTLTNGPSWVSGRIGAGAVSLDGSNDKIVLDAAALNTFGTYGAATGQTVAFWAKTSSSTTSWILSLGSSSSASPLFAAAMLSDGTIRFQYRTDNHNETTSNVDSAASINDNTWHHVALVRSGLTFKIYIDGSASVSHTEGGASFNTLTANKQTFGAFVSGSYDQDYWAGSLDEVRLYNRALTAAEIAALAAQ